jgi:exopolysaccharide production protein ExoQ
VTTATHRAFPWRLHGTNRSGLPIGRDHWLVDVGIVLLAFAPAIFVSVIGKLTAVLMLASLPAILWLRHERLPAVMVRCWPLLLLPLFALLSTAWSIRPGATGYYAFLYLVTVLLGVLLGSALDRRATLIGLFIAVQGYNVLSFLTGDMVAWGGGRMGNSAFAGLAGSKNMAGQLGAVGLLIALATVALGVRRRAWTLTGLAAASVPVACWILWFAHATGALVAGSVSALCLTLWLLSAGLPQATRGALLVLGALAVLVALATQSIWLPALFELVLTSSGKDAGLTGRADLWRKADTLIAQRPWVGLGYNGFWVPGNLDAEALWRMFGIRNRGGFNFHNSFRHVAVELGYAGLILYLVPAAVASLSNFLRALRTTDPLQTLACGLTVFFAMQAGFEVLGFGTLNQNTVLMFIVFAIGFRRDSSGFEPASARRLMPAPTVRRA